MLHAGFLLVVASRSFNTGQPRKSLNYFFTPIHPYWEVRASTKGMLGETMQSTAYLKNEKIETTVHKIHTAVIKIVESLVIHISFNFLVRTHTHKMQWLYKDLLKPMQPNLQVSNSEVAYSYYIQVSNNVCNFISQIID